MNNKRLSGDRIAIIAAAAIASGDGVLIGAAGAFGVAHTDAAVGESVELELEGVFELPKNSADTPAIGAIAYWDDGNSRVTTTSTSNTKIGFFVQAYAGGTTLADVRLTPNV